MGDEGKRERGREGEGERREERGERRGREGEGKLMPGCYERKSNAGAGMNFIPSRRPSVHFPRMG